MKKELIILVGAILVMGSAAEAAACGNGKKCGTVNLGNVYAPNMQILGESEPAPAPKRVEVKEVQAIAAPAKMDNQNIQIVCSPQEKVVYKDKIVYRDRVVYRDRIVYRDREVAPAAAVVKTEVKTVTQVVPEPVTKIVEKKVIVEVDRQKKNALSLLGLYNPTRLVQENNPNSGGGIVRARTEHEADLGLMYQRDFDALRLSIGGSLNGLGFLGAGLVF